MTTDEKLDRILAILTAPPSGTGSTQAVPAYQRPALMPSQITADMADGVTPLADGSVWATQHGGAWNAGRPQSERGEYQDARTQGTADSTQFVRKFSGYMSEEKYGPHNWNLLKEVATGGGRDTSRWDAWCAELKARPYQLFAQDPFGTIGEPGYIFTGQPNATTLFLYVLVSYGELVQ
jgi:hypothetical protein